MESNPVTFLFVCCSKAQINITCPDTIQVNLSGDLEAENILRCLCQLVIPSNDLFMFSLDQLIVSNRDQQKLQAVLTSVESKSDIIALIQEAKMQVEVSEADLLILCIMGYMEALVI